MMRTTLTALLLILWSQLLLAQAEPADTRFSVFDLYRNHTKEVPELYVLTDWRNLLIHKLDEEYQDAEFIIQTAVGDTLSIVGEVRSRGNRRKESCIYPPLRIKMKKKLLARAGFDRELNDLKLVLQCRDDKIGESYLMREYLIYQLLEHLSPLAYHTKLIRLRIGKELSACNELWAFLIEKEEEFQERIGGRVVETGRIKTSLIDRDNYIRMCFFQYLVLNHDWSVSNKHNLEFLQFDSTLTVYAVPYDFDYSGWVNANYAVPPPQLPIRSVTDPYFRGKALSQEEVDRGADYFIALKATLYQEVRDFRWLADSDKRQLIKELDKFYKLLANRSKLHRKFVGLN